MKFRYLVLYISFFVPFLALAHSGDHDHSASHKPVEFIKNEGQWSGPFAYMASFGNVNVFLEQKTITYYIGDKLNETKKHEYKTGVLKDPPVYKYHAYKVHLLNANDNAEITGDKPRQHYYNYFLGNDTSKWKSYIHPELAVDYKNIYDGIDMHYASASNSIKYDFIVHAGADAGVIALQYEGVDDIQLKDKHLIITTSVGDVQEMAPYAYQYIDGVRKEVSCRYKLKDNTVTFHFPKGYDETTNLIIDPNVVFATFTGSTADNWGFTATYDDTGNFYAGGIAAAAGYPSTIGPSYIGGDAADSNAAAMPSDMVITKFNPQGNINIYSTYIGGLSQDQPHSMVVDANGNLFIAGRSYSGTYPSTNGSTLQGGSDIVITKLSNTGVVTASSFVGGSGDDGVNVSSEYNTRAGIKHSYADDARSEILIDRSGNVYVASCTKSTNFPTVNATSTSLNGLQDGVVIKMDNNLNNLLWSTYLGGNRADAAYVLSFNVSESSVYVGGGTSSNTGLPVTSGTIWPTYNGGSTDGYIIKFQNGGSYPVQRGTYIGRNNYDQVFGLQVDDENNVYAMGNTLGGSFPVSSGVYSNANSSQFLIKLDSNLSTNIYSTVFGSGNSSAVNISPVAFLVDTCQNVYISGWGGTVASNGGNTNGMATFLGTPVPTPSGILTNTTDGSDFYFIVFSKNATALLFAAYYGGNGTDEHVDGGTSRFNKNGEVYQAICGGCGGQNIPTTQGAYSRTNGTIGGVNNCNLLALKIAFNLGAVVAKAQAVPNAVVCLGEPVNFNSNGSSNVSTYSWDFGDGTGTSTAASPSYTYQQGGTFTVTLIVNNPNACKVSDTATLTVVVDTASIDADFNVTQTDSCNPFIANFTNLSNTSGSGLESYYWLFGDGQNYSGHTPPAHTYNDTGTYTITLIMTDPDACNSPDSMTKTITFNTSYVEADFENPPKTCEATEVLFNNLSRNALTYLWDFGDGKTSTESSPKHAYDTAGVYTIKLKSFNTGTCNGVDSITRSIEVLGTPTAKFLHEPIIPVTNEPILFTNTSVGATHYIWDFGDGTNSQLETPRPKYYPRTGTYTVCLQAINEAGCSDTFCKKVDADVYPLADLPNAFSPNGDGANDVLYVRGSGIELLNLRIYNRWGELVFETEEQSMGWDGTFNGKEQPVEAYAYILNVTFIDGTTFSKKGNVTLLR